MLALVVRLGMAAVAAAGPAVYEITLNGKPVLPDPDARHGSPSMHEIVRPRVLSLRGTPDRPAPGDAVLVAGYALVLGEPGTYRFETSKEDRGALYRRGEDGGRALVALTVSPGSRGLEALRRRTDAELEGLGGLRLERWRGPLSKRLRELPAARTAVVVHRGEVPALPPELRVLGLDRIDATLLDLEHLRRLRALRLVTVSRSPRDSLTWLMGLGTLRAVALEATAPPEPSVLWGLTGLRQLSILRAPGFAGIGFVVAMPELRTLDVSFTGVSDLRSVEGHPALEKIIARGTGVGALPRARAPALRVLDALPIASRGLDGPDVDQDRAAEATAFRTANPGCALVFRWRDLLRPALGRTTRIRVRSGGSCHRNPEKEKTLFEVEDLDEIARIVAAIEIVDGRSGHTCMCCGDPTLEFRAGSSLLAMLSLHHGARLRWQDGAWPGDGELTEGSRTVLCRWLADHGVTGPWEGIERERAAEREWQRSLARYRKALPDSVVDAWLTADSSEARREAILRGLPRGKARARAVLRALGCNEQSWAQPFGLTGVLLHDVVPVLGRKDLGRAVLDGLDDPWTREGAARLLFGEGKLDALDRDALQKALPALARHALGHPEAFNRRRTLLSLKEIGGAAAVTALMEVLTGTVSPRPSRETREVVLRPSLVSTKAPRLPVIGNRTSDRAAAGYLLALMGHGPALPAIRRLHAASEGEDRAQLWNAVQLLER